MTEPCEAPVMHLDCDLPLGHEGAHHSQASLLDVPEVAPAIANLWTDAERQVAALERERHRLVRQRRFNWLAVSLCILSGILNVILHGTANTLVVLMIGIVSGALLGGALTWFLYVRKPKPIDIEAHPERNPE